MTISTKKYLSCVTEEPANALSVIISNLFENQSIRNRKSCAVIGRRLGGKFLNMKSEQKDEKQ